MLDMQTLGNIGFSAGFKNIIIDKENFDFFIEKPEDLWNFIRKLGKVIIY